MTDQPVEPEPFDLRDHLTRFTAEFQSYLRGLRIHIDAAHLRTSAIDPRDQQL